MLEERVAVKVTGVFADEDEDGPGIKAVVLRDEAQREMRVFIGQCEAQALAVGLGKSVPDRPFTYEAMLASLAVAGATVVEASINDLREGTFYAQVSLRVGEQVHQVDMRPSDALNVAVRAACPIFVSEQVFLSRQQRPAASAVTTAGEEPPRLSAAEVSDELARLFAEDQSDRLSAPFGQIDWAAVGPRDAARLARVKQLCQSQTFSAGMDYYHAAGVLQHAHDPDDHLMAHELCVVAVSKSVEQAKWLAAASEDRYLMNIGRPQRFGTQYRNDNPDGEWRLYEVHPEMNDAVRRAFNVPALAQAETEADRMNMKPQSPVI